MILLIAFAASVVAVPIGGGFVCTPTAVWDGDGPIWCGEGRGSACRHSRAGDGWLLPRESPVPAGQRYCGA